MRAGSGRAKPSREEKEYSKPRPRVGSSSVGRQGPSEWRLRSREDSKKGTALQGRYSRENKWSCLALAPTY